MANILWNHFTHIISEKPEEAGIAISMLTNEGTGSQFKRYSQRICVAEQGFEYLIIHIFISKTCALNYKLTPYFLSYLFTDFSSLESGLVPLVSPKILPRSSLYRYHLKGQIPWVPGDNRSKEQAPS